MKVAWLADVWDPPGGAELTQSELRAAAPGGVEVVEVPKDQVDLIAGCDVACLHNTMSYPPETVEALGAMPMVRYWNDMAPAGASGDPGLQRWALDRATNIFTSPLHRERFPHRFDRPYELVPPPVDLDRFKPGSKSRGACWLGSAHPGKGVQLAVEWAAANEPLDFWGPPTGMPAESDTVRLRGLLAPEDVANVLRLYRRFVFLPTAPEPFGRAVFEAWACGCELVVNRNIGALYWIERPAAVESAAADYWTFVERAASA